MDISKNCFYTDNFSTKKTNLTDSPLTCVFFEMLLLFEGIYFYFLTKKFRKKGNCHGKKETVDEPPRGRQGVFRF